MNSVANIQEEIQAIHDLGIPLYPPADIEKNPKLAMMQIDLLARERALMWVLGKDSRTVEDLYKNTVESAKKLGLIPE